MPTNRRLPVRTASAIALLFFAVSLVLHQQSAGAAEAHPFVWGVNGHPFVQEGYRAIPTASQLDLVAATGAGWYRFDVTPGTIKETALWEQFFAEAAKRNIRLLPVLMPSLSPGDPKRSPEELETNATADGKLLATFFAGRAEVYEIHNEMDVYSIVAPATPNGDAVTDYDDAKYQRSKAQIQGLLAGVHAVAPEAKTIVNAGGWYHYGFIQRLVDDGVRFDILGWHWYSEMGDMIDRDILEKLEKFGRPIWMTEINRRNGSLDHSEEAEATYITEATARYSACKSIRAIFIYELLDEPYFTGGEGAYGLTSLVKDEAGVWKIGTRKPAFEAFRKSIVDFRMKQTAGGSGTQTQ